LASEAPVSRPLPLVPASYGGFVTVFIRPVISDGGDPGPDLSVLTVPADLHEAAATLVPPAVDFSVARNAGAGVSAPLPRSETTSDMHAYVTQAALLPGEGATVVLRVEVLTTGEPGRIEVDVSSGSDQVDQAAVGYARTQSWYAGRVGNVPQVMWIRWPVRLHG